MFMPTGNLRRRRQMSRPAGAWSVPCMAVSRADCVQTSAGCVITLECITGRCATWCFLVFFLTILDHI